MPGILSHALFGDKVYRKIANTIFLDKVDFLSGNLIPDLATNKSLSHYYVPTSIDGIFIPNLKLAKKELLDINNSVKLGMFCHIYLDYYFIRDVLIPKFNWDSQNHKVCNNRKNKTWEFTSFFSQNGLYGFYTTSNQLILKKQLISLITISIMPERLPLTGIPVFDSRRSKSWRKELKEYLVQNIPYTGDVFELDFFWEFIDKKSEDFKNFLFSIYPDLLPE